MKRILPLLLLGRTTLCLHAQTGLTNAFRVNLQSPDGMYISAVRNFVPSLQANVEKPGMYEFFVMEDINGGSLQSGDAVRIYAHSGYVSSNESNDLLVASPKPQEMLEFQIERADGAGAIRNHDKVYFKTSDGAAIVQEGNSTLKVANGTPLSITLSVAEVNAGIAESFAQDWKAGWGIGFDNSPQGTAGRKLQFASALSSLSGFRNTHAPSAAANTGTNTTSGAGTNASAAANTDTRIGTRTATNHTSQKPATTSASAPAPAKQATKSAVAKTQPGLPANLPLGYYKCYVDHVSNLAMAGYFTLKQGGKYVFHGFDPNTRSGTEGMYTYDSKTGKINWLSGAWKTNNYYGLYSLDATYGDRIYLIPTGSDYSACKCFLQ